MADEARALPPAAGPGDTRIDSTSISLFHRPEFDLFGLLAEEEDLAEIEMFDRLYGFDPDFDFLS